jgi:type III restriction enzyme
LRLVRNSGRDRVVDIVRQQLHDDRCLDKDGAERLYLVVETKSSLFMDDLRDKESAKIECGRAHFKALQVREAPARYVVARSVDELLT